MPIEVGVDLLRIEHVVEGVEVAAGRGRPSPACRRKEAEPLSPASTAGRVRIIRLTSPRERAAAAIATARKVLPVPAGPIPKVIVCLRIESTYCFWLTVFGAIPRVAVLPDDVLQDLRRALVLVERAGDGLDRAGSDLVALLDQVDQLARPSRQCGRPRRRRRA